MWRLVQEFPEGLVEALERDDHGVKNLLENSHCADVSVPTELAATRGSIRVDRALVWSTNYTSYHENVAVTALMAAARNGHAEVVDSSFASEAIELNTVELAP